MSAVFTLEVDSESSSAKLQAAMMVASVVRMEISHSEGGAWVEQSFRIFPICMCRVKECTYHSICYHARKTDFETSFHK